MTWGFLLNAETELDLLAMRGGRGQGKPSMAEQVGHLWKERKRRGSGGRRLRGWRRPEQVGATQQEVPARAGPEGPGPRERAGLWAGCSSQEAPWLSRAVSSFRLLGDGAPLHLPAQAGLWTSALCSLGRASGWGCRAPGSVCNVLSAELLSRTSVGLSPPSAGRGSPVASHPHVPLPVSPVAAGTSRRRLGGLRQYTRPQKANTDSNRRVGRAFLFGG